MEPNFLMFAVCCSSLNLLKTPPLHHNNFSTQRKSFSVKKFKVEHDSSLTQQRACSNHALSISTLEILFNMLEFHFIYLHRSLLRISKQFIDILEYVCTVKRFSIRSKRFWSSLKNIYLK